MVKVTTKKYNKMKYKIIINQEMPFIAALSVAEASEMALKWIKQHLDVVEVGKSPLQESEGGDE